jgi:hypothetical protein
MIGLAVVGVLILLLYRIEGSTLRRSSEPRMQDGV